MRAHGRNPAGATRPGTFNFSLEAGVFRSQSRDAFDRPEPFVLQRCNTFRRMFTVQTRGCFLRLYGAGKNVFLAAGAKINRMHAEREKYGNSWGVGI